MSTDFVFVRFLTQFLRDFTSILDAANEIEFASGAIPHSSLMRPFGGDANGLRQELIVIGRIGRMESGSCEMHQYYSVWADGENFRPVICQNEDEISRKLYQATSLASLEPLKFSPKDIQEDLEEEAEINPAEAETIVKARYERGYADCIYVWPDIGPVLILSQRAVDVIETVVGNDGEYFRFDVDRTTVYLFHCTKVLNCLDVGRSEIICHSSCKRLRVEQYAFNREISLANVFFRIAWPDEDGRLLPDLFATERLLQIVESLGLSGFRLKVLKQIQGPYESSIKTR